MATRGRKLDPDKCHRTCWLCGPNVPWRRSVLPPRGAPGFTALVRALQICQVRFSLTSSVLFMKGGWTCVNTVGPFGPEQSAWVYVTRVRRMQNEASAQQTCWCHVRSRTEGSGMTPRERKTPRTQWFNVESNQDSFKYNTNIIWRMQRCILYPASYFYLTLLSQKYVDARPIYQSDVRMIRNLI